MTPKKLVIIVRPPPNGPFQVPRLAHTHDRKILGDGAQAAPWQCPGCTLAVPWYHVIPISPGGAGAVAWAVPWLHPGCPLAAPWRCRCKTFRPALAVPWRCRCGAEDGGLRFRTTSGRGHPDRRPYLPDRFRVISGPPLLLFFIIKDLPGPSLIYKKNHHRNQQRT